MAQVIGTVAKLVGVAYARASDGSLREMRLGDDVFDGEVLLTAEGSAVELTIPDAPTILVAGGRELLINGELTLAMRDQAEDASVLDETLEAVVAALEGDGDLLDALEATAAGGSAGDEGNSFVRLGRIGFDVETPVPGDSPALTEAQPETSNEQDLLQQLLNDGPIAIDDAEITDEDASVTIAVLVNDADPDGALAIDSVTIVTNPSNGAVVVNADGTVTYTPNADYNGVDTFTYTVSDDDGVVSNTASVGISIEPGRELASFTDTWVDGVEYATYATQAAYENGEAPVVTGLTGDEGAPGSFSYDSGEFIVFMIGDVVLGEFGVDQLSGNILFIHDIAGLALSNTNAGQLENTAIFLQALDADLTDGDLSNGLQTNLVINTDDAFANGINITADIRAAFEGYIDPATGEPLDLQTARKGQISDALETQGVEFTRQSEADPIPNDGNQNVFETIAIDHVPDTVPALAGERAPETCDAR